MEAQGWPRTLRLEQTIHLGDEEYETLTFPEPCAQHVRGAGGNTITFGTMMGIVTAWAGVPAGVVKELGAKDVRTVMAWMTEAMGALQGANFDADTMPAPVAPLTIPLKQPITLGKRTITELEIRRVIAKHFYSLPVVTRPTMGDFLDVAGLMTGEAPAAINKLSVEDAAELIRVVQGFLSAFQGT
jgi:hypothetical protein